MTQEWPQETGVQKYKEYKQHSDGISPRFREFLKHSGMDKQQLEVIKKN
jgi:hypothetical protein